MKSTLALEQLTTDELHARKQKLQGAIIGLGVVMVVAAVIIGYVVIQKQLYGLLAIGFTMFIALLPSVVALNNINAEIKARKLPH